MKFQKNNIPWNKGKNGLKIHSEEVRKTMSQKRKGVKLSVQHRLNISKSVKRGENHPNWKGGLYPEHKIIRKSVEYRIWKDAVLKRDNYKCIWCGYNQHLEADHIKSFSEYPELRFAIDNGRTLCKECHKKTDNYGGGSHLKR